VLVRWIASPINPLDLNIIEGRYALISPKLPAIGGCEAVGIAERVFRESFPDYENFLLLKGWPKYSAYKNWGQSHPPSDANWANGKSWIIILKLHYL
jgi:hypothetical protein